MKAPPRLAVAALLLLVVALILLSETAHRGLLDGLEAAERIAAAQPVLAMAIIVGLSALGAMLAFVSSWVLVPFAVLTWGPLGALALLWSGWLLGGAASYAIGRYLGRPAVRRLLPAALIARYEARLSRHTLWGFVLLVQMALPSEIPGYLLGIARYSLLRYLAALGLVELLYGVLTIYLGTGVLERRLGPVIGVLAVFAAVTLVAAYLLRRRTRAGCHA